MPDPTEYRLISADSHVVEPPDLFDTRLPSHLRERAPRFVERDGGGAWVVGAVDPVPLAPTTATGSGWHRSGSSSAGRGAVAWSAVLPALYDPAARINAQWEGSVDAEVLYPTPGLWDAVRQLDNPDLKVALARSYNDWLAEFCAHDPSRLIGLAKIPATSVTDACAELERAVVDLGLKGAILDDWPSGASAGGRPDDDPLWEAVDALNVPISLHYGMGAAQSSVPPSGIAPGLKPPMCDAVLPMVAAGVFDRYPGVRLVLAHGDAGWALHWMEFLDINYVRHKHLSQYALVEPDAVPSDYIRKHTWFTFHQDRPAVKNQHRLGRVHLMWASHFPFDDANWPDDRQQAMRVTDSAQPDDRHALLAGNVARLYRLPGHEGGFGADEVAVFEQLVHF